MTGWEWGGQCRSRALGGRAGGDPVHPSAVCPCRASCGWQRELKFLMLRLKERAVPVSCLLPSLNHSLWTAKKKKVLQHYFPNKSAASQPEKDKTCKQLSSKACTDCCALGHPASCWQPHIYIGNQIRRYLSWDMHREYSPMSNLISM